jgi:SnoaL-like protein
MSDQSLEVVRNLLSAHEGEDVLPALRSSLRRLGPNPQPDAAMAVLADDPGWKYYDPDIEWDTSDLTEVNTKVSGLRELAVWWSLWVAAFSRHEYKNVKYAQVGDWVLTVSEVDAHSCDKHIKRHAVQLWHVRDGKVTSMRAFKSEDDARAAAAA